MPRHGKLPQIVCTHTCVDANTHTLLLQKFQAETSVHASAHTQKKRLHTTNAEIFRQKHTHVCTCARAHTHMPNARTSRSRARRTHADEKISGNVCARRRTHMTNAILGSQRHFPITFPFLTMAHSHKYKSSIILAVGFQFYLFVHVQAQSSCSWTQSISKY